jgi:hypothetical protein
MLKLSILQTNESISQLLTKNYGIVCTGVKDRYRLHSYLQSEQ